MWTRREFAGGFAAALQTPGRRTSNVLVVMSDQESALLPGPARLPNRERIASRGVTFTHAFCNTPQCSPARAALLTGLDPHKAGVLTNVDGGSLGKPLSPDLPSAGSLFAKAGYSTGYFGKWHLGGEGPGRHGFRTSETRGADDRIAASASEWIRAQKQPWLAWVSLLDPHHIYDAPRNRSSIAPRPGVKPPVTGLANLKGKPVEQQWFVDSDQGRLTRDFTPEDWVRYRSYYLTLVEKVDALLGQVLEAAGSLDNTVLVYTSDHGDALGEHGLPFKGPFMYEELIRIPFVFAAPGRKRHPADRMVTQADLLPMLVEAAGIEGPSPRAGGEEVLLEYYAKQKHVNPIRTIRTRRWKLNVYDSGGRELYDLQSDPHERANLAGETRHTNVQSHLQAKIDKWRAPLGA